MLKKIYWNQIVKRLANLQLAIFLLFTIGILIAFGTVIEQDQSLIFYKENYPENKPLFGFLTWKFITLLHFDTLYNNVWFYLLLGIFAMSLMACTFTTQLPSLKKFRLWKFIANWKQLFRFNFKNQTDYNRSNNITYQIYRDRYHIFRQGKKQYAYSGLLGRIGPIVVHFSIIIFLVGTSIASISSYNVQEIIPRGEICHLQNLVKSNISSNINQQFSWRVNNFWVTYTQDAKINQFYSDLSVLNSEGTEIKRKTIFVNEPLVFEGLTVYQTDWDILGIKIKLNDNPTVQIALKKVNKAGGKFWLGSVPIVRNTNTQSSVIILINDLQGSIYCYDNNGVLIKKENIGTVIPIDDQNILKIEDVIMSTGLQIKEDLGITTIYLSFFFIMLGVYISFLSYSQIWSLEEKEKLFLAGTTNRAVLIFQENFKKLSAVK